MGEEKALLEQHPRYEELCAIHGEPNIVRKLSGDEKMKGPKPGSLAARLTRFTFYIPHNQSNGDKQLEGTITKDIPRTVGIYVLKGIVARLYGLRAMGLRLIWETEEWDPVAGESDGWSVSDDDTDSEPEQQSANDLTTGTLKAREAQPERAETQWVRREVELVDGTKDVGFWIESADARVRIELR